MLNVLVIPGGVSLSENIYAPGMLLLSIILGALVVLVPNGNKEGSAGTVLPLIVEDTPVAIAGVTCTST